MLLLLYLKYLQPFDTQQEITLKTYLISINFKKMDQKDQLYTRDNFIKLLEENFGAYDKMGDSYVFRNFNNKQIAEALTMAESQFSKLLNPSKLEKTSYYKRTIDRVLLYGRARAAEKYKKERDRYKKKQRIYSWITLLLFLLFLVSLDFVFFRSSNKLSKVETQKRDGIYVYPPPKFEDILGYHLSGIIGNIKLKAILTKSDIDNHIGEFTRTDSLNYIARIRTELHSILTEQRVKTAGLNFRFPSGDLVMDSLLNNFPSLISRMFLCNESEILDCKYEKDLPKNRTSFDLGVFLSKSYYFDRDLTPKDMPDKIEIVIKKTIEDQQKILLPN